MYWSCSTGKVWYPNLSVEFKDVECAIMYEHSPFFALKVRIDGPHPKKSEWVGLEKAKQLFRENKINLIEELKFIQPPKQLYDRFIWDYKRT